MDFTAPYSKFGQPGRKVNLNLATMSVQERNRKQMKSPVGPDDD